MCFDTVEHRLWFHPRPEILEKSPKQSLSNIYEPLWRMGLCSCPSLISCPSAVAPTYFSGLVQTDGSHLHYGSLSVLEIQYVTENGLPWTWKLQEPSALNPVSQVTFSAKHQGTRA